MNSLKHFFKFQPKELLHGFQPILHCLGGVGQWPFTIIYDSSGSIKEARVYLVNILWFFLSISLYLLSTFYTYEDLQHVDTKEELYFSRLITNTSETPTLLFATAGIILNMIIRKRLINILNSFISFDREVSFISH